MLLSLEDSERTRTRLLVTEMLAEIVTEIIDVIPGKVSQQRYSAPDSALRAVPIEYSRVFRCLLLDDRMHVKMGDVEVVKVTPRRSPSRPSLSVEKVPRIEVRVVGTRALPASASRSAAPPPRSGREGDRRFGHSSGASAHSYHKPSLHLSALWNGDHAASVNLSTCEDDSLTMSKLPVSAAGDRVGGGEFGGSGFGFGNGNGVRGGPRGSGTSRLVVLPLHVPWIMERYGKNLCSYTNSANNTSCGVGNSHRRSGGGFGGCGGVDGGFGNEDGRSHCLQVTVDVKPPASVSDRASSKTFSTLNSRPRRAEVCFFERDLLRSEWTEFLIPVCTQDLVTDVRSRKTRHHNAKDPPADLAVILQARSAGFSPQDPPLWLLRRDCAERAVERIISAAAAALVQPRVEITLLGLSGAVDSLLSERAIEEKGGDEAGIPKTAGPLLPAKLEARKGDDGCDEVLCEAFWNGTILHKVRLHLAVSSSPSATDESTAVVPYASRREVTSATGKAGLDGIRKGEPASSKEEKEQRVDGAVTDPKEDRPAHPRDSDPSTWFSGGRGGDEDGDDNPLGGDWVALSGGEMPAQNDPAESGEAAGRRQDANPSREGEARRRDSRRLSGTTDANDETNGEGKPRQPLVWVPAEGEIFGGRPFRFFLPACPADDAAGGQAGASLDARGEKNGSTGVGGETINGSGTNGDADTLGDNIRGDLRLVFWAISSSSSAAREPNVLNVASGEASMSTAMVMKKETVGEDDRVRAAAGERRRQRGGEGGRRLLGWASLVDDELLLQPRGRRIELALSAKAGLDVSTAWSMAHDLKRYVTCWEWVDRRQRAGKVRRPFLGSSSGNLTFEITSLHPCLFFASLC